MTSEADHLEAAARTEIEASRLDDALEKLGMALALREQTQGAEHPDLIWTLSLMIQALSARHTRADAREAARLGERRLLLRRSALADAPAEIALSLLELAYCYEFEDEPFDPERIRALRSEARAMGASDDGW
ncbi:MAG: hypothetical protein MRY74_15060 [Neomegalonema sp.]|nr:hypothetical protein [Neomegalonema sp.]